MIKSILADVKSLVALHGILPPRGFFSHLRHLPLIAADGTALELLKMGITPQLIVGDLDSLATEQLEGIEIIKREDQNYTDFEKTMEELVARDLLPTFVVGTSGKELDHTLYNLHVLGRYAKKYANPFLVTDEGRNNKLGIICRTHFVKTLAPNTLISLLPFPQANITTKGLVWDVQKMRLSQERGASIRNRVRDSFISVKVHSGALLILFDTTTDDV